MRLLVLNVDRDNDLGRKTGIQAPCIGREEVLRAATALAVADPEEADANGMFAAVKEYDEIAADPGSYDADAVFVAAVTGHIREGTQADAAMAHQIDQVLSATGADHCILVSDGGEDEHVMPIIQTRMKVDGVKRVIIKQAKNLEGFLFLFHRLIHDEKLQRKFFLPFALLLVAGGASVILRSFEVFVGAALFLAAFYIFVQVFSWGESIGNFFASIGRGLQAGKLSFYASVISLVIVIWAGFTTLETLGNYNESQLSIDHYSLFFLYTVYWKLVAAVLVVLVGRAADELVREGHVGPRKLQSAAFFAAAALVLHPVIETFYRNVAHGEPLTQLLVPQNAIWLNFAGFLLFVGLIVGRYYSSEGPRRARAAVPPT